eukprot:jgi/Mesen1/3528/ME000197S02550
MAFTLCAQSLFLQAPTSKLDRAFSGSLRQERVTLPISAKYGRNLQTSLLPNSLVQHPLRWPVAQGLQDSRSLAHPTQGGKLSVNCALLVKESCGGAAVQGTERVLMEDNYVVELDSTGKGPSYLAVFDGHGGPNVSEFLKKALWPAYKQKLASGGDPVRATVDAYLEVDLETIAAPKGLFGMMRERGMGGPKCGATAATAVLLSSPEGLKVVAANAGDSRVVLARAGKALQLSVDHKVYKAGGVWRVGGLLALSRAFGDVYLKDWSDGLRDGARGGFGLTAEPSVTVESLTAEDKLLILGTDGLFDFVSNQEV